MDIDDEVRKRLPEKPVRPLKRKRESCLNCGMPLDGFDDVVCSPECAEKEAG